MNMQDTQAIRYILAGVLVVVMALVDRHYKNKQQAELDKSNKTRYIQIESRDDRR